MTKEELIKHLEHLADYVKYSDDAPALREAIKMLTNLQPTCNELATNCISRRAAIDICAHAISLWHGQLGEGALIAVRDKIKELPSAQPELIEQGAYVRGFEQGRTQGMIDAQGEPMSRLINNTIKAEWTNADALDLQPTCNELATNCISRRAAIDTLADYIHNVDKVIGTGHLSADDCKDAATSVLEDLPSAQPERIQNNAVHLCDSCQYTYVTCPSHDNDAVFGDGKGNDNICACNKYRPISAQPDLDEWCTDCKEYDQERHSCPRWNRVIRETLKDAQPTQQWIPCSERLPEPRTAVLGYAPKYKNIYALYYDSVMGWMVWSPIRDDYFPNSQGEIVAWCELPEPYQEVEHDG